MILLVDLLAILLCAQVFMFSTHDIVSTGIVQYALAAILLGWAGIATVVRRKPSTEPASLIAELFRAPRVAETLLIAAYISAANSWLNLLSSKAELRVSTPISVLTGAVCAALYFLLARFQDQTGVTRDRKGRKRVRATLAWVVLMVGFALPLVGGVAASQARDPRPPLTPELAAPEIALAWLCFCSFFLAAVLFRPWVMRMSSSILVSVALALTAVLGASAVLEQMWRRDWYLYALTSIIFLGTALGIWRVLDSLCAATLGASPGSRVQTCSTQRLAG